MAWLGRYDQAIAAYDLALRIDARNGAVWRKKALALKNLNHLADALSAYDRALEIDSNDSQALVGKGDVLSLEKKYSEAFAFYQRAEKAPESSFQASDWVIRGNNLQDSGKPAEAILYYDRAIALDPNYSWAWIGKGLSPPISEQT